MADPELIGLLQQGSDVWNRWRQDQPSRKFDLIGAHLERASLNNADLSRTTLSRADLRLADLREVNLSDSRLYKTDLSSADLFRANLSNAQLISAYLNAADLTGVNLRKASLIETDLRGANLNEADLSDADLRGADISGASLKGAILKGAKTHGTIFSNVDLRSTEGLLEIDHQGPSRIELHSVRLPRERSALHFLRGAGVPDEWIDFWRSTMMHPIQYYSCFISYSGKDEALARRLHADLQAQGVRCWFAPEDMKIGDKIRVLIDEAIHLQDKLLLILSAASVTSDWVEHEVEMALAKERKEKSPVLFPIRVDRAILDQEDHGWPALVRHERHIGDFSHWTSPQAYQQAFERLLRDLKAGQSF